MFLGELQEVLDTTNHPSPSILDKDDTKVSSKSDKDGPEDKSEHQDGVKKQAHGENGAPDLSCDHTTPQEQPGSEISPSNKEVEHENGGREESAGGDRCNQSDAAEGSATTEREPGADNSDRSDVAEVGVAEEEEKETPVVVSSD